jgi:hypothetical protein
MLHKSFEMIAVFSSIFCRSSAVTNEEGDWCECKKGGCVDVLVWLLWYKASLGQKII